MLDSRMPEPDQNEKRVGLHYKRNGKWFIDSTQLGLHTWACWLQNYP
jgi:hypothetical protein